MLVITTPLTTSSPSADREFNDKRELMVKIGDKEYSTYADVAGELMVLLMLDPVDGAVIDDLEDWYPTIKARLVADESGRALTCLHGHRRRI